jgi:O-acetyl-ADP-ribose deacetylase (regulator of RNase III)
MIKIAAGNLLKADADAIVNTVNTVGVMGKGIALQFKQAFPDNYKAYRNACERNEVQPGRMFVFSTNKMIGPKYIINFPTKRHWKGRSRMEDIEAGLKALVEVVIKLDIHSIAIPPLGCGSGGLNWDEIKPRIDSTFRVLPDVLVLLYKPQGAPETDDMSVETVRPKMSRGRAALLGLAEKYIVPGYTLTLLEIQKLAYFLQAAGEPLRLNFVKDKYGPYAETLHHVLQRLEGHFIRGYGDRSRHATIRILPGVTDEVNAFLSDYGDTMQRFSNVARLIEGFESPYGMELLSTVHWLAQENPEVKKDSRAAVDGFKLWSEHKKQTFNPEHIEVAWRRLHDEGWI